MQINFSAKKLKEANKYLNLLTPPKVKKEKSFLKKLFNTLFK